MSGEVKRLVPVAHPVNEKLVEALEEMLGMAKRGEMVALIAAAQTTERSTLTTIALDDPRADLPQVVFAIESAKFQIMRGTHRGPSG